MLGELRNEFRNDVTQTMRLPLTRDVSGNAARILNVFLAIEDIRHCFWFRASRVPHMHGEDNGVLPWIVVENRLRRRIRQDPSIPI